MALVVLLRGVNVGGHRSFRPSALARALRAHDVVNIGAAGTFVVRKPGSRAALRESLARAVPFTTEVMLCDARDVLRLQADAPFDQGPAPEGVVRFVSVLARAGPTRAALPIVLPPDGEWLVRVIERRGRFLFGEYRRHMKTIGYLGRLDALFGAPATTRNWNTLRAIVRVLEGGQSLGPAERGGRGRKRV